MHWEEMASILGRKLVEDGQTRILQRIYEGVTSNWVLDIADDKSSIDHHLIHLVWRKFPRNRHSEGERRLTAATTQTEKGPNATLDLGTSAGLTHLPLHFGPRKIWDQQSIVSYSGSDLGNLFGTESASTSDAGGTTDCSPSSMDSVTQEGAPYKFPAKGRTSKPKIYESKSPTKLVNRFKCLEVNKPENGDTIGVTVRKSPSIDKYSKRKDVPPLTSEIPTTSSQDHPSIVRRRGIVKWFDSSRMSYGFIKTGNSVVFFHVKNVHGGGEHALKPGDEVSFIYDDYDQGAMDVQFLPIVSDFPTTSITPTREMESTTRDESWETVDSENEELSVPSRVSTDIRGTVKSYDRDRECGYITLDGSHECVPFWADPGSGLKPRKRVFFGRIPLGQQQAKIYPLLDEFSNRWVSESDSDY